MAEPDGFSGRCRQRPRESAIARRAKTVFQRAGTSQPALAIAACAAASRAIGTRNGEQLT